MSTEEATCTGNAPSKVLSHIMIHWDFLLKKQLWYNFSREMHHKSTCCCALQLHNIDMKEGTDIEEKISKARDLKNLLAILGEPIPENLLLNKLPHSYEDVIQNLSTMDVMPSLRGQAPSWSLSTILYEEEGPATWRWRSTHCAISTWPKQCCSRSTRGKLRRRPKRVGLVYNSVGT